MKNNRLTLWTYIIRGWKINVILLFVIFLGSAASTIWGVFSANALTSLVSEGFSKFIFWIQMMAICLIVWVIQIILSSYFHSLAIQKMNIEIRKDIAEGLSSVDKEYIYDKSSGSYVSWLVNDILTINEYGFGNLSMILSQIFNIILGGYVLFSLHYSLIFSILFLSVLMFLVPKLFSRRMNRYMFDISKDNESFTHNITGLFKGLGVLFTYQSMSYFVNKIVSESEILSKSRIRYSSYSGFMQASTNGVSLMSQILLLMQAGWLYSLGYVAIGSLTATQYFSATIFSSLTGLSANWIEMKTVQEIFDKFSNLYDSKKKDNIDLPSLTNKIQLNNISYSYPGSANPIVENISFSIEKGKKYALIGRSGSGKTTLLNLLFGRLRPTNGEIYYDGISYESLEGDLFQRVAYVEQESVLFSGSILENIILDKDYDEIRLQKILTELELKEWIDEQTEGILTPVDWAGKTLSGGQKQKLALARALYLEKDIIFLDESVSAIDKVSAQQIEIFLLNQTNLTLILITHHLNPDIERKLDGVISL